MRPRITLGALALLLSLASPGLTDSRPPVPATVSDAKHIAELIQHLGSSKFQERSAAQKELEAIGAAALEQLKKAAQTADLETSKRAGDLVRKIEDRITNAGWLAPKRVRLHVVNVTVQDAVNELAKLSGYRIQVSGDRAKVVDKRITLDTGDVTFWEAFDKLCTQAGLVEYVQPVAPPGGRFQQGGNIQFQVQGQPFHPFGTQPTGPTSIMVIPGTPSNQPVSYAGSVRWRIQPVPGGKAGEYRLRLDAAAEPRLQGFHLAGTPNIERSLDEHGQNLVVKSEPAPGDNPPVIQPGGRAVFSRVTVTPPQTQAMLRFTAGSKAAKTLKELSGTFIAQVQSAPEALITLENVLKGTGESAKGKNGGVLRLNSIVKQDNGDYKAQIYLENPSSNGAGNLNVIQMQQVQVQIGGGVITTHLNTTGLPELLDAADNKLQPIQIPHRRMTSANGLVIQEMTIVFRGTGEPARLVLNGTRAVSFTVPFRFRDVPTE